MTRVSFYKLLTNLASSSRTGEYWHSVVFVRSVRTATTPGQYSPVRPPRSVIKKSLTVYTFVYLIFVMLKKNYQIRI